VATCGTVGSMIDRNVGAGDGDFAGTIMVGRSGTEEGNGPDDRCADGVCLWPHADFLLASLAAFRSVLSISTKSLSLSMFPYFK